MLLENKYLKEELNTKNKIPKNYKNVSLTNSNNTINTNSITTNSNNTINNGTII